MKNQNRLLSLILIYHHQEINYELQKLNGTTGLKGNTGNAGAKGDKGDKGDTGPTGTNPISVKVFNEVIDSKVVDTGLFTITARATWNTKDMLTWPNYETFIEGGKTYETDILRFKFNNWEMGSSSTNNLDYTEFEIPISEIKTIPTGNDYNIKNTIVIRSAESGNPYQNFFRIM